MFSPDEKKNLVLTPSPKITILNHLTKMYLFKQFWHIGLLDRIESFDLLKKKIIYMFELIKTYQNLCKIIIFPIPDIKQLLAYDKQKKILNIICEVLKGPASSGMMFTGFLGKLTL